MSTNKPRPLDRPAKPAPDHGVDFFAWTMAQARSLEARQTAQLDYGNLAEEIRSLGNAEKSEIESRLTVLLQHLLKWAYQPEGPKGGWEATIFEQRRRIARRIEQSPSLRAYPAEMLADEYEIARRFASAETGLAVNVFPATCPFAIQEVLDIGFYPEAR